MLCKSKNPTVGTHKAPPSQPKNLQDTQHSVPLLDVEPSSRIGRLRPALRSHRTLATGYFSSTQGLKPPDAYVG